MTTILPALGGGGVTRSRVSGLNRVLCKRKGIEISRNPILPDATVVKGLALFFLARNRYPGNTLPGQTFALHDLKLFLLVFAQHRTTFFLAFENLGVFRVSVTLWVWLIFFCGEQISCWVSSLSNSLGT